MPLGVGGGTDHGPRSGMLITDQDLRCRSQAKIWGADAATYVQTLFTLAYSLINRAAPFQHYEYFSIVISTSIVSWCVKKQNEKPHPEYKKSDENDESLLS